MARIETTMGVTEAPMTTIPFLSKVLAASIAYFLLGWLWYSPLLFGPDWKKAMKKMPKRKIDNVPAYSAAFLAILLSVYVLGILLYASRIPTVSGGALIGFVVGLAFVASTLFSESIFTGIPPKLFMINASYRVAGMTIAGAILLA